MKHSYFCLTAIILFIVFLSGCKKEVIPSPVLQFTQTELRVGIEGGTFSAEYTLENPFEGGELTTNSSQDWISNLVVSESSIKFDVNSNNTTFTRNASIELLYKFGEETITAELTIKQIGLNYYLEASDVYAEYLGSDNNIHEYLIVFADKNALKADSKNYQMGILTSTTPDYDNLTIPVGTYKLSTEKAPGSIYSSNAAYAEISSTGNIEVGPIPFNEAEVVISKSGDKYDVSGFITDNNLDVHKVVYSGPIPVVDASMLSTLTEDIVADMTGCSGTATFYGDFANNGTSDWYVWLLPDSKTGEALMLDLYLPGNMTYADGLPEGEFVASKGGAWTFLPGFLYNKTLQCSWYFNYDKGFLAQPSTPINGGKVKVTKNSGGTYTIVLNGIDDNYREPHTITATWTGIIALDDQSAAMGATSVKSTSSLPNRTKSFILK